MGGKKNVCIIGAGIAGLTAGALLTKKGYNVTLFEKEQFLGGRALSFDASKMTLENYRELLSHFRMHVPFSQPELKTIFEKNMLQNYKLDLGYHAIGGGVLSNVNAVLNEFNEHVDILESYVGLIKKDGYDFPFLSKIDKLKILPNILRLLFASEHTLKQLDKVSITETIQKYGRGKMKLILEIFSRSITTVNNLDRISTGEMFRSQRNLYRGSKPVGYPKNGLDSIHKKLASVIEKMGGHLHLDSPVEKILIKNKRVYGVRVKRKDYFYDTVVYSCLLQDLFSIADENEFPSAYVETLKSLTGTGSLCAYYALRHIDPALLGKTFHFIERNVGVDGNDAVGMIDFMAASPESGLAPSNRHLVQAYIICTPEEAKDKKILVKLKELLDINLKRLIPEYETQLDWAIYPAIWHLDGVAKTIDNDKPSIITPVKNLYVIGDGVKAMGIGFNCALNSARALVDYFEKN